MDKKTKSAGRSAKTTVRRTPSRTPARGTDLAGIFNTAAKTLAANRSSLNQADAENHNHGDNMAQAFKMIAQRWLTSVERLHPNSSVMRVNIWLRMPTTPLPMYMPRDSHRLPSSTRVSRRSRPIMR